MDRLNDFLQKKDLGAFYTHELYAKKTLELISSVVIFELKRPDRVVPYDDFSKQVRDQVKGIRRGQIKNYKGQNITTGKSMPIFAILYAIQTHTLKWQKTQGWKVLEKLHTKA